MTNLIAGVLLFSVTHLMLSAAPGVRTSLARKLGENGFKGVFAFTSILGMTLIVMGWKATVPETFYVQPSWGRHITPLLVLFTFLTFFAPYSQNSLRKMTRHPQLLGVVAWGIGHLLSNGEIRSVILFGGFAIWAMLEVVMINRRDGAWDKPSGGTVKGNIQLLVSGLGFFALFMYSHVFLFGVSPVP
jgi:uncharacterized membrane protein